MKQDKSCMDFKFGMKFIKSHLEKMTAYIFLDASRSHKSLYLYYFLYGHYVYCRLDTTII